MATVTSILVKIGANSSELRKELTATKKELNETLGSEVMAASKKAVLGIAGVAASLGALGAKAVQAAGNFQQVQAAMTNMLGSADRAKTLLGQLQDFAAKTPFEFNDVAAASQKFLAFGFTAEQIIPTLRAVGDAAAGVGMGKEGIDRITLALGQMAAKSKVQSDEMLQLTEAGIPAWQMLADKIGVSIPQAMDMVSKGAVDAQTGLQALVGGMEERFGGMMDQQSQTITGTWSNMMDGLSQTAIAVGQKISDALNLPDLFSSLGDSFQQFADLVKNEGIGTALSEMIPPEVQIAAAGLAATLTAATIPALTNFALSAKLAALPLASTLLTGLNNLKTAALAVPSGMAAATTSFTLIKNGAVAAGAGLLGFALNIKGAITSLPSLIATIGRVVIAFGPLALIITAVGIAIAAFISSGHELSDLLNVMPGTMDAVNMAGDALKRLWGELGQAISNLVSVASPLITIMATVFTAAIYAIIAAINVVVAVLSFLLATVSNIVTGIIAMFNWAYEGISSALSDIGNALSDMADSILPEWVKIGLSTIRSFVQTAIGWLQKLIDKIFHTNNALSNAGKTASEETGDENQPPEDNGSEDYKMPTFDNFSGGGADAAVGGAAGLGGSSGSSGGLGAGSYDEKKFRETILGYMDENQGRPYDGFECTVYVKSGLGGAGVDTSGLGNEVYEGAETNDRDANAANSSWIQTAIAHGAWHPTDPYGNGGENAKPGDVWVTNNGNHVLVQDTNGYYSAGGYKGVLAHYDQDVRSAFAGNIVGYIDSAQLAGVSGGSGVMNRPQFNWDQSIYTQATKAAASAYSEDPALLLAVAMKENGGNTVSGLTMEGGNGGGMMQILSGDQDIADGNGGRVKIKDLYPDYQTNVYSNALAGAAMLQDKINANGGDVWKGVADYYGGEDKEDYAAQVRSNYAQIRAQGAGGSDFVQNMANYRKKMAEQALQTHQQIDDSYAQSTATQVELTDRKFKKEYEKLNESKAYNANYQKDKEALDAMYAQEHLKAVEADAEKEQQIRSKATEIAANVKTNAPAVTDTASEKELSKMEADYDKAIESIKSKWQQYSSDYASMTKSQKAMFLKALDDENIAYEVSADGRLSFAKEIYAEELAQYKSFIDEKTAYYQQAKDIEADIDEAKNQVSLEKLQAVLTDANAMRLSDYEAQKAMLDTYQETYLAAHASTAQMVSSLYSTAFDGLSSAITNTIMGTKTLGDAFAALGKSLIQVVVEFYAKQLAGMLVNSAMAKSQTSAAIAQTAAEGAAMSAALGPAAFFKLVLDPSSAGVAMSLMAAGTAASMATSMASTFTGLGSLSSGSATWSEKQSALNNAPWNGQKLASGGITKGATIAMIGEGHHDEAVLPLSRDKFEQLGLIDNNKSVNSVSMSVNALDASSFTDFLRNGGADAIKQMLFDSGRDFTTEAGVW